MVRRHNIRQGDGNEREGRARVERGSRGGRVVSKLTKPEAKAHTEACERLEKDVLTDDDKRFVWENWQESANHVNSAAGAFFTPFDLAMDFALEVGGTRVIDLCAGAGFLSLAVLWRQHLWDHDLELTCVEINPAYVALGRKLLPEATWIEASIFDLPGDLGRFDYAISNPPFGNINRHGGAAPRFSGKEFEYHVIDIASSLADCGAFIIPQGSAGFRYSGARYYERNEDRRYAAFHKATGLTLDAGIGIDCSIYRDDWHGVAPQVEIACVDFTESAIHAAPGAAASEPENLIDLIEGAA